MRGSLLSSPVHLAGKAAADKEARVSDPVFVSVPQGPRAIWSLLAGGNHFLVGYGGLSLCGVTNRVNQLI